MNSQKKNLKKTLIEIKDKKLEILHKLEKLGYMWQGGQRPTDFFITSKYIGFNKETKKLFISDESNGYKFIISEEVFLNNYMVKNQHYQEENKEFTNEKESEKKSNIFYMVWRTSGGSPTKRHDTYDSALEEAKRLANKNPNCEFLVLESKAIVKGKVEIDVEVL